MYLNPSLIDKQEFSINFCIKDLEVLHEDFYAYSYFLCKFVFEVGNWK